jgi:hypothetical protein
MQRSLVSSSRCRRWTGRLRRPLAPSPAAAARVRRDRRVAGVASARLGSARVVRVLHARKHRSPKKEPNFAVGRSPPPPTRSGDTADHREPGRSVGQLRPCISPTARLRVGRSVGAHRVRTGLARVAGSVGRGRQVHNQLRNPCRLRAEGARNLSAMGLVLSLPEMGKRRPSPPARAR